MAASERKRDNLKRFKDFYHPSQGENLALPYSIDSGQRGVFWALLRHRLGGGAYTTAVLVGIKISHSLVLSCSRGAVLALVLLQ